jgi:hypothetical protein
MKKLRYAFSILTNENERNRIQPSVSIEGINKDMTCISNKQLRTQEHERNMTYDFSEHKRVGLNEPGTTGLKLTKAKECSVIKNTSPMLII